MKAFLQQMNRAARRLELWDWILWFGGGAGSLVLAVRDSNGFLGALGVLLLVPGIAQFAGHRWAWHAGLVSFVLMAVLWTYSIYGKPFSLWRAALIVCFVWGLWQHWTERDRIEASMRSVEEDADSRPSNSLVLWLSQPRFVDEQMLNAAAGRALGARFDESDDAEGFVVGKENHFILRYQTMWFILYYHDQNYFEEPDQAAECAGELRRMNSVKSHVAWLAMDLLRGSDDVEAADVYRIIGEVLGELADDDVVAVFHPETGRIEPWAPELKSVLSGGRPLELFESISYVPVIRVSGDSKEMEAAVAEARRRWPEFVQAFFASNDREGFSVKAPVSEGGNTEFIWITVKAINAGSIHGFLANDPVALGTLKLGDFVTVNEAELNDWCYPPRIEGERPVGLFTLSALRS